MSLSVKYLNGKKFEVKCRTHTIITDQPVSADGTDRGMTPVEMLNGALASCAAHYALLFLSNRTVDLKGLEVQSSWQYSACARDHKFDCGHIEGTVRAREEGSGEVGRALHRRKHAKKYSRDKDKREDEGNELSQRALKETHCL